MRYAMAMCPIQRIRDLNPQLQSLVEPQRTFLYARRQRLAIEVFHQQKIDSILATDIVQNTYRRMIERGYRPRLPLESLPQIRLTRQVRGQDLDCHNPIQPRIERAAPSKSGCLGEKMGS